MHTACLQRQAQTPTTRCLPQAAAESMSFLLVFCFCCPMLPCIACFLARYNRTLYYFRVVVVVIVIVAVAVAVRFSCYYAFYTLELFKTLVVNAQLLLMNLMRGFDSFFLRFVRCCCCCRNEFSQITVYVVFFIAHFRCRKTFHTYIYVK